MTYSRPAQSKPAPPTYYEMLGLHPSASVIAIRKAYHELSKQYHPDTTPLPPALATAKFQELNRAYTTLLSPEQRLAYNQSIGYSHLPVVQSLLDQADQAKKSAKTGAPNPFADSSYLDPCDRPLSSGEVFALLMMVGTLVGCLGLALAVGLWRSSTGLAPL